MRFKNVKWDLVYETKDRKSFCTCVFILFSWQVKPTDFSRYFDIVEYLQ